MKNDAGAGVDFSALVSQKNAMTRLSVKTAGIPVNPVILESPVTQMSAASAEAPATTESTIGQMSVEVSTACLDPVRVESPIMQIPLKTAEAPDTPILVESSTTHISHIQTPITPTPFTHSTSLRLLEVLGIPEPDILESVSSFNNIEKQKTLNKDRESDIGWMDEVKHLPSYSFIASFINSSVFVHYATCRASFYRHSHIRNGIFFLG